MKNRKRLILAVFILGLMIGILFPILREWSEIHALRKNEDALYSEMSKLPADKLIAKINRLEKKLQKTEDKIALLPLYVALMDKADEFSADQLIEHIQNEQTLSVIDSAFARMYAANGYPSDKLMKLLSDPGISEETKEEIVVLCDFSPEELMDIILNTDGKTAQIAMKRLSSLNPATTKEVIETLLSADTKTLSEEQYKAICLGIAGYYEDQNTPEDAEKVRENFAPVLKKIFKEGRTESIQDQAIYALGRICDAELFAWLIENKEIDFYLKISVIERNSKKLQDWVESAKSEEEIHAVLEAMKLHPIVEIGFALEHAMQEGRLSESEELLSQIESIKANGIHAVNKYE